VNPLAKLGLFGLVLVAVLGGGAAAGSVFGPIDTSDDAPAHTDHDPEKEDTMSAPTLPAGGLLVSEDGYTFVPETRTLEGGPFAFAITGPDGRPVVAYDELHDRQLHLIIARRDLRQYAHLHPTLGPDGTWTVEVPDLPAGGYRAFADFQPSDARQHTLGIDLTVPGVVGAPEPLTASAHDEVDDYEVELLADHGAGTATVTVRRQGEVVTTEPYLGAAGHLVALRDGDLAYLHVHPLDDVPAGPVDFAVDYPSSGRYALFFDFQVDGVVRTARFVVDTEAPAAEHGHGGG
jgi:hypothetical protein